MLVFFQRFKDNFPAINRSITQESKADLHFRAILLLLLERKGGIMELFESYISHPFSRGDYNELVKLVTLYLSGEHDLA